MEAKNGLKKGKTAKKLSISRYNQELGSENYLNAKNRTKQQSWQNIVDKNKYRVKDHN